MSHGRELISASLRLLAWNRKIDKNKRDERQKLSEECGCGSVVMDRESVRGSEDSHERLDWRKETHHYGTLQ